ncbi:MAG: DUF1343 domain-containing protein [Oscillospiraceae bacterium]|nr:DUF1343 domain-containing protein [Oscillospiraceae bacterium]MBR2890006.1 DUF1343 domain-containing protein [Oscillospiraceae bacterium]
MVLCGADRIAEFAHFFTGRVALLTSPTGRTRDNRSTIEVLKNHCDLILLLAPEHGVRGDKPAGALFSDELDEESRLPVRSLYTKDSKRLSRETLEKFDTLVYDIADVGCRYYTFISTLRYCMEDCAAAGKRLVVLDRPNPLGDRVEGGLLREDCASFVGSYPLPVCYGLTCGELARMMNGELGCGCDLHIVPCGGLTRQMTFRDWNHYWVMPSLNIPRYETALLYPGTCLFEGTNLSEGRGTADPFAIIGAPYVRSEELARAFNDLDCPGVIATPVYFTPTTSKHQGTLCGGIHLHITDEAGLEPVAMGVKLVDLLRRMYPEDFRLLPPFRKGGKHFLSLLAGHRDFENHDWDAEAILSRYAQEAEAFRARKEPYEIYSKEN